MSTLREKLAMAALTVFLPMIGEITKEQMKELCGKFLEKDPEHCKATLQSLYPGVKELAKFALATKTKIDDTFAEALQQTIEEFCTENEIDLPDFTPAAKDGD